MALPGLLEAMQMSRRQVDVALFCYHKPDSRYHDGALRDTKLLLRALV